MNNLVEIWNKSSQSIPLDKSPSRYAVEKEKFFPRQSLVCDLGGGIGKDSLYFLQHGHTVTLVDISDYALNVAQESAQKLDLPLKIVQYDLTKGTLPLPDNYFDVIYSRLTLHYFTPQRTVELFQEVYRVLKEGGKTYITLKSPVDEKEMEFLKQTAKEVEPGLFDDNGEIKSRYSSEQLEKMLKQATISQFQVRQYLEDLGGRVDKVKSLNKALQLNEIIISK